MAGQNKSVTGKFILILILILVFIIIAIFMYQVAKYYFPTAQNQTNTTTTIIQNIDQSTTIEPGKSNVYDMIIWLAVIIGIVILTSVAIYFGFKMWGKKKLISDKHKDVCIAKSRESLIKSGYLLNSNAEPVHSYIYYGIDDSSNPVWAFIFPSLNADITKPIHKLNLIHIIIDAKTLRTFNEGIGKDFDDLKKELHDVRFGKVARPNFPGKTEKEPTLADLFGEGKTKTNIGIQVQETEEEDEE